MKLPELPPADIIDVVNKTRGFAERSMLAYGRACADAALERAAQVCDDMQPKNHHPLATLDFAASAIRALKVNP